jgi:hypothetical protein
VKFYEASETIRAKAETIWSILTDAPGYGRWDSGAEGVDGEIALGQTVTVRSKAAGRAFPVKVTEFVPARRMVWSGGMPLGLFKGARRFELQSQSDGTTHFLVREEYTGPLLPLMWRSMPDLGPSFTQLARGLKAEAERRP